MTFYYYPLSESLDEGLGGNEQWLFWGVTPASPMVGEG